MMTSRGGQCNLQERGKLGGQERGCKSPTPPPMHTHTHTLVEIPLALPSLGMILGKRLVGFLKRVCGRKKLENWPFKEPIAHSCTQTKVDAPRATTLGPQAKTCQVLLALASVVFLCFSWCMQGIMTAWAKCHSLARDANWVTGGRTSSCSHWFPS